MAVLEVPLLSGLRADTESLEQVRRLWQAEARGSLVGGPAQSGNSQHFLKWVG